MNFINDLFIFSSPYLLFAQKTSSHPTSLGISPSTSHILWIHSTHFFGYFQHAFCKLPPRGSHAIIYWVIYFKCFSVGAAAKKTHHLSLWWPTQKKKHFCCCLERIRLWIRLIGKCINSRVLIRWLVVLRQVFSNSNCQINCQILVGEIMYSRTQVFIALKMPWKKDCRNSRWCNKIDLLMCIGIIIETYREHQRRPTKKSSLRNEIITK